MARFFPRARLLLAASSLAIAVPAASASVGACSGGGGGAGPDDAADGDGAIDGPSDGSSATDAADDGRADARPPKKDCLPYLQSGTPLALTTYYRALAEDPSDGLAAFDPTGDVSVGRYSVTNFYVARKSGGFRLHCASSTLSIAQMFSDASGNVYLAGTYRFVLEVPGAAPDGGALAYPDTDGRRIFLAKFDAKGELVYMQRYEGAPTLTGAALGSGGHIWLTGTATNAVDFGLGALSPGAAGGSAFLVELDLEGVARTQRTFGNASTKTGRIAVDPDGSPVVALYLGAAVSGSAAVGIGYGVLSLSSSDPVIRAFQSATDKKGAVPASITVSAAGDVAIAGRYLGAPDFGGGPLPPAGGEAKPYVAKLTRAGAYVGARALPPSSDPPVGDVTVAFRANGNLVVGGSLGGSFDFGLGTLTPVTSPRAPLLLAFDPAMNLVGASTFAPQCLPVGSSEGVRALVADPSGALHVVAANGVTSWVSTLAP